MARCFILISDRVRENALAEIRGLPAGWIVRLSEPKRSLDQNAMFHAILTDIARSGMQWAGKRRTVDEWKMLLVSAHAVATQQAGEVIPGIEGEFVAIRESTASMTVARATSLIEYTLAFCAEHGIPLTEAKRQGHIPDNQSGTTVPVEAGSGVSRPRSAAGL